MKKILWIMLLTVLLSSCFGWTENDVLDDSSTLNSESQETLTWSSDEVIEEEMPMDDIENEETMTSTGEVELSVTGSVDDQATEEVMEDFEKDINELFNMIENDGE